MKPVLALLPLLCTGAASQPESKMMEDILNSVTASQLDAIVRACHPSAGLTDDQIDELPDPVVFSLLRYCRGKYRTDNQIIDLLREGIQ